MPAQRYESDSGQEFHVFQETEEANIVQSPRNYNIRHRKRKLADWNRVEIEQLKSKLETLPSCKKETQVREKYENPLQNQLMNGYDEMKEGKKKR